MSNTREKISIILCCYNSAEKLLKCLEHLATQSGLNPDNAELLLVDNASTDDSVEIASSVWRDLEAPFPLKIVFEERQGLAFARVAGVLASTYSLGIFCDDDNWLPENYAIQVADIFCRHSEVGVIGSASVPVSTADLPPWFYRLAPRLAVGNQADVSGDITANRSFVWGAGMAVRLDALRAVFCAGIQPRIIGRQGRTLTSGDDSEICVWFIMLGYRIWYENGLVIRHYMPVERLTDDYFTKFTNVKRHPLLKPYFAFIRLRFGLSRHKKNLFIFFIVQQLFHLLSQPLRMIEVLGIYRSLRRVSYHKMP